jgi:hypothetical protein
MSGRHRKVSHIRPRHHHPRHRKPPSAGHVLAPAGLAVAVLVSGSIALAHSGSGDRGSASGIGGGIVLAMPSAAPLPRVQAQLTSRSNHQAGGQSKHHQTAPQSRRHTPHTLVIHGTGPACYVQVTRRDGRVVLQRVIHGRHRLTYDRHGLSVVLGNAGAVRVAVDGHRAHRAGRSGQVVHLHVR